VAEEILTQEAAAQLGQDVEDIADAVHHGQTPQMLFSIKGCRDWKSRDGDSELGTGERELTTSWPWGRVFVCPFLFCF
jgi:hypothetical protein